MEAKKQASEQEPTVISYGEEAMFVQKPGDIDKEYLGEWGNRFNPWDAVSLLMDKQKGEYLFCNKQKRGKAVIVGPDDLMKLQFAFPPMGYMTMQEFFEGVDKDCMNDTELDALLMEKIVPVRKALEFVLRIATIRGAKIEDRDNAIAYTLSSLARTPGLSKKPHWKALVEKLSGDCDKMIEETGKKVRRSIQELMGNLEKYEGLEKFPKNVVAYAYAWIQEWLEANGKADSDKQEDIKEALLDFPMLSQLLKETRDARFGDTLIGVVDQIQRDIDRRNEA